MICITDQNIDGAEGAMKIVRSILEYFEKCSQAKDKLLAYQKTSNIAMYKNRSQSLQLLQDVSVDEVLNNIGREDESWCL